MTVIRTITETRWGALVVGIAVGAGLAVMIDAFATMRLHEAQNYWDFFHLRAWRMRAVIAPFFTLIAMWFAIKGKLRRAAWFLFGAAFLHLFSDVIQAVRYWP